MQGNSVHIIVLSWNGWRDTLECLESLFHLDYPDFTVIVVDNASSDGSAEKVMAWAEGKIAAESANPRLSHLISPPCRKPMVYRRLTLQEAEADVGNDPARLILIQNTENVGFAAGNNLGLRYALRNPRCHLFWLLNNDTVVEPDALAAMVREMENHPNVGLCGSLNLFYSDPDKVQAEGGMTYNRWTARVRPPSSGGVLKKLGRSGTVRMDYVNGASALASRAFLETVGLMEESYFLYFEEMDWAFRARGCFQLGYARDSVIYHKEGASIGTSLNRRKRSLLSERYLCRNRALFTRRFLPWALPTVILSICLAVVERLCWGEGRRAKAMLESMFEGLFEKIPRTAAAKSESANGSRPEL